jgi:hypothetical protein
MENQDKVINLIPLPADQWKIWKYIKVTGPEWNYFSGYIHYKRIPSETYSEGTSDYIDEKIMEAVKTIYPTSVLLVSKLVGTENQAQNYKASFKGGISKTLIIQFSPEVPFSDTLLAERRKYKGYILKLPFNIELSASSEKTQNILTDAFCSFSIEESDFFLNQIQQIQ